MALYSSKLIQHLAQTVRVASDRLEPLLPRMEEIAAEYIGAVRVLRRSAATNLEADGRRRVAAQAKKLRDMLETLPDANADLESVTGTRELRVFEMVLKAAVALADDDEALDQLRKPDAEGDIALDDAPQQYPGLKEWVREAIKIYETAVQAPAGRSTDSRGRPGGPLLRFLILLGEPLGLNLTDGAWDERIREARNANMGN